MKRDDFSDLRWRHVEGALRTLLPVSEEELGAFRARLRHLRAVGLPDTPKVGSGTQITYTRDNVIELYVALLMMMIGIAPSTAATLVLLLKRHPFQKTKDEIFLVIVPPRLLGEPTTIVIRGLDKLERYSRENPGRIFSVVRLSQCIREVEAALAEQVL